MTIGIAAIALPDGYFVAVSDQMLSYGDIFQATDQGAWKTLQISDDWHVTFSGDAVVFKQIVLKIIRDLRASDSGAGSFDAASVMRVASEAYSNIFDLEFAAQNLFQIGYRTVADLRRDGLSELGDAIFSDYHEKLAQFDLEVDIVIFGYDNKSKPWIFQVVNPGRVIDCGLLGYAVLGSGYHMAMGSLTYKPLCRDLENLVYRLLEAKFSAETASGVGKGTTLITVNQDGIVRSMESEEVQRIREVWEKTRKQPIPDEALELISNSEVVNCISDGER